MGNTYTCDGCGLENLDPLVNTKTLHWCQRYNSSGARETRNVLMCTECEAGFDGKLKSKPNFIVKTK